MSFESRLQAPWDEASRYEPSPDLFARLTRSIEEDRTHRRRVRRVVLLVGGLAAVVVGLAVIFTRSTPGGRLVMPRWTMEVIESVVMVATVLMLGPALRRFGRYLVQEVLATSDEGARRFLTLLDLSFYLVLTGLIVAGTQWRRLDWEAELAGLAEEGATRVAVLVGVIGALHALTVAVLPVIGLLLGSSRRRRSDPRRPSSPEALLAERVAGSLVGVAMFVLIAATLVGAVAVLVGLPG